MRSVPAVPQESRATDPACPFVGREREIQLLVQHAMRPFTEGPGIAVVTGVAGMGKTTLLTRLADELTGHLVITTAGRASAATQRFAVANQVVSRLHDHGIATQVVPCAQDWEPHAMGQRLLTALSTAAAGRPLTVIVDDVQNADVESSLALGFATRRMYGQQIQLVLAVRAPDDSGQDSNVARIMPARGEVLHTWLAGLSVPEIQALGHAIGMAPLRPRDARLIRAHCDGNPRHVTRLLEEMRRDPHVRSGRTPLTLRSFSTTCAEQLAALPAQSRWLMWALAVLDDRYPLSTVARVAGVAQPLHALEPLLAAGLVQWWPAEPTTPLRIGTPPLRQAAYDGIAPALRRQLHERAAAVVPADRALTHRMLAAQGVPDPALADDLAAAGWRWTTEGNLVRAAQYLRWAADVSDPGEAGDRRLLFGISLLQRGGQYEAAAALRDRARRCRPSPLRGCVMGRYAMVDGDLAAAMDLLESSIAELERVPWTPDYRRTAAIGYTWLALLHSWLGDPLRARSAAGHGLAVSPFGRRMDRSTELVYLSTSCELDGPVIAAEHLTRLADLPAAPNEVDPSDVLLLMFRGNLRVLMGRPADGVADLEAGLATSRAAGMNDIDDWAHFWAAGGHIALGSWDRALEHATAALDIVQADGRPHVSIMMALLAYVEANTGQLPSALEHAVAATELADDFTLATDRMLAGLATAAVARAKGDHIGVVEALRPFGPFVPRPSTGGQRAFRWLWWPTYVDALIELGRIDDAEAGLAAMSTEITGGYRVLIVPWLYLTARTVEAGDTPAAALTAYEAVLRAPSALGSRWWRGRAADAHRRLRRDPPVGGPHSGGSLTGGSVTGGSLGGSLTGSLTGNPPTVEGTLAGDSGTAETTAAGSPLVARSIARGTHTGGPSAGARPGEGAPTGGPPPWDRSIGSQPVGSTRAGGPLSGEASGTAPISDRSAEAPVVSGTPFGGRSAGGPPEAHAGPIGTSAAGSPTRGPSAGRALVGRLLAEGSLDGGLADSLTARERAVAALIADGLTNKAVSGYLGITEKTIEAHLTRVYRKLTVRSRAELRAALHGRALLLATRSAHFDGSQP